MENNAPLVQCLQESLVIIMLSQMVTLSRLTISTTKSTAMEKDQVKQQLQHHQKFLQREPEFK